jgi:hypothetical protein
MLFTGYTNTRVAGVRWDQSTLKADHCTNIYLVHPPPPPPPCCQNTSVSLESTSNIRDRSWKIYTYFLHGAVLLEQLNGLQPVKKFPSFYGTRMFITAFTNARHLSVSWISSIQSILPHPTYWRSILILSSHLRLSLPSRLIPPGFPAKTLYTPLLSPIRATCPVHLMLLHLITRTILSEECRSLSFSLCSFLHSLVTSSLLDPNHTYKK